MEMELEWGPGSDLRGDSGGIHANVALLSP